MKHAYFFYIINSLLIIGCYQSESNDIKGYRIISEAEQNSLDQFFGDVESQDLRYYPKEVDSLIDFELCKKQILNYEKSEIKSVYHPATFSVTFTDDVQTNPGPFVDSSRIIAIVEITYSEDVESWYFSFDSNWGYNVELVQTSPRYPEHNRSACSGFANDR